MRNEKPLCHYGSLPLNITIGPFSHDKKAVEVDRILELLIESRFGPGRYYQKLEAPLISLWTAIVSFGLMPSGFGLWPTHEMDERVEPEIGPRRGSICGVDHSGKVAWQIQHPLQTQHSYRPP